MRLEAITWQRLTEALAERLIATPPAGGGRRLRVALDGAPAARPEELAAELAEALRLRGRPVLPVAVDGFLRPASLRFEYGKQDPDAFYDLWYDTGALWREVFDPLEPDGDGRVLPDLWNPATDRATRSERVALGAGGVLLLHGPLLLGRWFPFDLTVHLSLSAAALARRTSAAERWTLPAFARYEDEVGPAEAADVVVRADRPEHPAWNGPLD
ncbi:uridine kinase [Streptomyces armeniacus]|uniref:Uridine kinase n=1 Tax=Streptomyces armeniacus TaxID=83291 RepID=A0A345XUG4_9ACTN|nr:uridine kinase [Streptomyces armeniacus]AXK35280.1 uridine kinase [Streptomyces armeniacus]